MLDKLAFDTTFYHSHLHIAQTACILAAGWLKLWEDAFVDLRFEMVDAFVNNVIFQQSCL